MTTNAIDSWPVHFYANHTRQCIDIELDDKTTIRISPEEAEWFTVLLKQAIDSLREHRH